MGIEHVVFVGLVVGAWFFLFRWGKTSSAEARKLVAGFKNVTMAFLENETLLPIVRPTTMPFGQALLLRPKELRSMWDIKPSLVKKDGQVMRQIQGKPQYYMAWQAVGNFKHNSPWFDARLSGLNGTFSA